MGLWPLLSNLLLMCYPAQEEDVMPVQMVTPESHV